MGPRVTMVCSIYIMHSFAFLTLVCAKTSRPTHSCVHSNGQINLAVHFYFNRDELYTVNLRRVEWVFPYDYKNRM